MAKTPVWQRKAGKNPSGGLNEAGRRSLKAAGHDIKRPQPEGGSRRDSFCARMKGMKAKLTSAETANDPDSRINKSLRAWNCHADGGAVRPELGGGGDALKAALKLAQDIIHSQKKAPKIENLARVADKFVYHSGVKPDIEHMTPYLEPQHGSWIKDVASGAVDNPEEFLESANPLLWMSDKPNWVKSKIGRHLGKPFNQITDDDIRNYGHVALIPRKSYEAENIWKVGSEGLDQGPYSTVSNLRTGEPTKAYNTDIYQEGREPFGVERNEYISAQPIEPMYHLTGDALLNFLNLTKNRMSGGPVRPEMGGGGNALKAAVKMAQDIIKAYHGSPHKFDKFDISKIGTGEGAQAYGHGLYFAESEPVARGYQERLSDAMTSEPRWSIRGVEAAPNSPEAKAASIIKEFGPAKAAKFAQRTVSEFSNDPRMGRELDFWRQVNDVLSQGIGKRDVGQKFGHMYEVRINADPNAFLDWDKPLSEQSPVVREVVKSVVPNVEKRGGPALSSEEFAAKYGSILRGTPYEALPERALTSVLSAGPEASKDFVELVRATNPEAASKLNRAIANYGSPTGAQIYHALGSSSATNANFLRALDRGTEASAAFREAGIPGIKYLDAGSRGAGEGSRNYVVFDPSLIDIMRRYADGGRIPFDEGGLARVEDLIRQARGQQDVEAMSHPVGVSGNVEFAPVEIEEPLTQTKIPLGSLPASTAAAVNPIANLLAQYGPYAMGPIPAGLAAARDVGVGLREGSGFDVATAALGAPGKFAKYALPALGAATNMLSADPAEAGPRTDFLRAILEKYRKNYDPSLMVDGLPSKDWLSSVKLSRPIGEMSATFANQRDLIPRQIVDPSFFEGGAFLSGFGDRSAAGKYLTSLNDVKLRRPVNLQGGESFMRDLAAQGPDTAIWGGGLSPTSGYARQAREVAEQGKRPFFNFVAMGPESSDYSHMMTDTILGMMDRKAIPANVAEDFDAKMRKEFKTLPAIENWPGIKSNKLESWLYSKDKAADAARTKMAKVMDAASFRKAGMADVGAARFAITQPELLSTPSYASGRSIGELDPTGRVIKEPKIPHGSYPAQIGSVSGRPGYIGGFEYDIPYEVHFKNEIDRILAEKPGLPESNILYTLRRRVPVVEATPEWTDRVSEYLGLIRNEYGPRPVKP